MTFLHSYCLGTEQLQFRYEFLCLISVRVLLLLNQKMDFEIIIQECFLGDHLPKLLKRFRYVEQNGRQGYKEK